MNFECLNADSAELLLAYTDGTLAPEAARLLEAHTASCPACAELVARQQSLWSALDSWDAPELSADFNRNLHAAVALEENRRGWLANLASWLSPAKLWVPAAGALAVGALAIVLMPARHSAPVVEQKAGMDGEARQLERVFDDLEVLDTLDAALSGQEKL
jgi:anti-sigma factor RsiW